MSLKSCGFLAFLLRIDDEEVGERGLVLVRVRWIHESGDDPVWISAELDEENWENRKVEIWANGRRGYADANNNAGQTMLSVEPWPDPHEIDRDEQFEVARLTKAEFETIWDRRTETSQM